MPCASYPALVTNPLVARIKELEAKQLKLGGVWKASERYTENTLVSFQGGLWLARADTDTRPGAGSPAWRLAVKSGDAKGGEVTQKVGRRDDGIFEWEMGGEFES